MYLIFDVSAAGSPKNWNRPPTDPFNWPRMVHLAWLLYDKTGQLINSGDRIVKPDTYEPTDEILQKAGLNPETVQTDGVELSEIVDEFLKDLSQAKYAFAHNLQFAENVFRSECYRLRKNDNDFKYIEKFCIMRESTHFCKLPGKGGRYKWPTLQELHMVVFKKKFANPNNAWSDVIAASTCLFELLKIDAIEL